MSNIFVDELLACYMASFAVAVIVSGTSGLALASVNRDIVQRDCILQPGQQLVLSSLLGLP